MCENSIDLFLTDGEQFLCWHLNEYIRRIECAIPSDFIDDCLFGHAFWVAAILCNLFSLSIEYFANQFTTLFDFLLAVVSAEVAQMLLSNDIVLVL